MDQKYFEIWIIFFDIEKLNWIWDQVVGVYFWYCFYLYQLDLNFDNLCVFKEVLSVMWFWFDMGIDGLCFDVIFYFVEWEGINNENFLEIYVVFKKICVVFDVVYLDWLLLVEVNQWLEDMQEYFGDGDECYMVFYFLLMLCMYMVIVKEDCFFIMDILCQILEIFENC